MPFLKQQDHYQNEIGKSAVTYAFDSINHKIMHHV